MKITAIMVALNDAEFMTPCIKAIYNYVDRICVQTNFDRCWSGARIERDDTVERILSIPDSEGKISLHIARLPDQAVARNWLMYLNEYRIGYEYVPTNSSRKRVEEYYEKPDYFWIIDSDEIYDPETIPAILDCLEKKRPRILRVHGLTYFKSWNYRVSPHYHTCPVVFARPGTLLHCIRDVANPFWFRLLRNKFWNSGKIADYLMEVSRKTRGELVMPMDKAVFHHGSYVGNDKRMAKKILCSGHHSEFAGSWYNNVWKAWTPESADFHPVNPGLFKEVRYVPKEQLPSVIRDAEWPDGYLR
ncbi:MAG: hypothetical protein ABH885_00585 [Candidatus Omnitrophota bacterium]